ncbi:hypothetical protein C8Q75DRAFT_732549 [Abortiporus biennis]|nr:hypothetical protein C8Q75DRAFT_732549 [Abortiporus biennis]
MADVPGTPTVKSGLFPSHLILTVSSKSSSVTSVDHSFYYLSSLTVRGSSGSYNQIGKVRNVGKERRFEKLCMQQLEHGSIYFYSLTAIMSRPCPMCCCIRIRVCFSLFTGSEFCVCNLPWASDRIKVHAIPILTAENVTQAIDLRANCKERY